MDRLSTNAVLAIPRSGIEQPAPEIDASPRRHFFSLPQLAELPPPQWHVDQILAENSFACLYGPSGSYKTFLALSLGLSIANGIDFAGRPVRAGSVAYVAGEGCPTGFRKRWHAWNEQHRGSAAAPLRYLQSDFTLTDEKHVGELRTLLEKTEAQLPAPFGLVIIDTLARALGAYDESSAKDMGRFIKGCQDLQSGRRMTVLLVAHTGKKADKGIRGSSSLTAALDTILSTQIAKKKLKLQIEKQKESERTRQLYFEMKRIALADGTESLVPILESETTEDAHEDTDETPGLPAQQEKLLAAIQRAGEMGITVASLKKSVSMSDSTFADVRKKLLKKGLIARNGNHLFAAPHETLAGTA
jgi:hypothetical protein